MEEKQKTAGELLRETLLYNRKNGYDRLTAEDEAALDRYEGYPSFYYKTEMTLPIKGIRSGKVRNRKCFVYIMHEDRPLGIPSGYYVATCLEGYYSFEFDERYLYDAIENSRRDCNEG